MLNEKNIKKIIETCKNAGYDIRIRDIAYCLLTETFEDKDIVYKIVFGINIEDTLSFDSSAPIQYLRSYMKYGVEKETKKKKTKKDDVSFEENRAEMIKLLKQTQTAMDDGSIEMKDGLKIMADIRVKLNDKFNVNNEDKDKLVIVEKKFNHICERFNIECYLPTKEELMEIYGLVEKN